MAWALAFATKLLERFGVEHSTQRRMSNDVVNVLLDQFSPGVDWLLRSPLLESLWLLDWRRQSGWSLGVHAVRAIEKNLIIVRTETDC